MTGNLTLALLIGVLFGTGVVLLMSRGIVRAFLGVLLISNGINLMFIVAAGNPGRPPIVDYVTGDDTGISDPLPQALVLTAIVIGFAMTGFVVELAIRARHETSSDHVDAGRGVPGYGRIERDEEGRAPEFPEEEADASVTGGDK